MTDQHHVVGDIYKNAHEVLRCSLDEWNGHNLLNLRIFFDRDGEQLPGKQGVAIRASAIPELIQTLQDAEAEAVRRGIVMRGRAPE